MTLLLLDFHKLKFTFSNIKYKQFEEIKIKRSESLNDYYLIIYIGAKFGCGQKKENGLPELDFISL